MLLGMIEATSPIAQATLADMEQLWNQRWSGGGYGRYHVSSEPDSPGPWPFASLFVARALAEAGDGEKVWRVLRWLSSVPGGKSGAWFEFYGPRPSPPCPQVGVTPWTWAEMVGLLVEQIAGVRLGEDGLYIRPRLLAGVERIQGEFPLRGARLHLEIRRAESPEQRCFRTNGQMVRSTTEELVIAYEDRDMHVEAVVG
jgi:cellobiose phosphorylase